MFQWITRENSASGCSLPASSFSLSFLPIFDFEAMFYEKTIGLTVVWIKRGVEKFHPV